MTPDAEHERVDPPLYIDTDNAVGSPSGNVDDGFALAALLRSGLRVAAIGVVAGNTSADLAAANTRRLAGLVGYDGPVLGGERTDGDETEASRFLQNRDRALRVVALGPLTNVGLAVAGGAHAITEIVLVGTNPSSRGRRPPVWPHELNLTHDLGASRAVFDSEVPLTVVSLDLCDQLRIGRNELDRMPGGTGEFLRNGSERWLQQRSRLFGLDWFRLCDLVAALVVIDDGMFKSESARVRMHANGWVEYGAGSREVRRITGFDPGVLWRRFLALLS